EVPFDLAGVDVDRDDAVGVKVVAFAYFPRPLRSWLTRPVKDRVLLRIVAAAYPDGSAANLERIASPRFAAGIAGLLGNRVERPEMPARFGVIGLNETARRVPADDHFAFGHQRRLPRKAPRCGRLGFPHGVSRPRIHGDKGSIGASNEHLVVVDRRSSL